MPSNVRRARIGERIHRLIDTYCKFALALWAVLLVFLAAAIALWIWLENGQFSHDEFFTIVIVIWVLVFVVSLVLGIMARPYRLRIQKATKGLWQRPWWTYI